MSQYDCASIEKRWQEMWREDAVYRFDPKSDKPIYSIDNPPRYTSGPLHLGHATGYSLIDFAARYKRMKGFNVFFPLCFDVNGTPIEVKVEKKHNITKLDLPRAEYRKLCSEYANGFIDEMTHHFEILGESMDPSIYYQTDAPYYRRVTQISFAKLFKQGLVYKANFPVNWCPRCMTALADAEVEYEDNVNKLNYIKFQISGGSPDEYVMVATTRPELLCTCKCVAVHPDDKEKQHLIGKELVVPLTGRLVKVISDPKVQMEYGTGNVMICTIGDKDDLEWAMKYHFEMEKGIDETGKMTELAGKYAGMPVKEAREAAIQDLKDQGILVKQEDNPQNVSICWRCHTPIEYLQVPQWFLKTTSLKEQVLKRADEIKWYPEFMKIRLQDWTNSLAWDWVLSRQRIFATPVPVWECEKCGHAVCATEEMCYCDPTEDKPPVEKCPECGGELIGCTDVFDTWMDSSGSALYNTFWERDPELHKKMFPMSMRPQSHDIIRTWAFYSILRSEQIEQCRPWDDVMIHGFIMAPDGTPMHSSIGNVIDPIPILENYGADALRYYAATCSLGIDHAFREKDVIRGKKLSIKVFNIGQFVSRFIKDVPKTCDTLRTADKWIISKFSKVVKAVTEYLDVYQFDKAMKEVEGFIWHEFADNYVEMVKARSDDAVRYTLYNVFLGCIKMLAIFQPHITEDVYQEHFQAIDGNKSIHLTAWPEPMFIDEDAEVEGNALSEVLAEIRAWKSERKIALNAELSMIEFVGAEAKLLESSKADISETTKAKEVVIAPEADLTEEIVAIKPLHKVLGPAFKAEAKAIVAAVAAMDVADAAKMLQAGAIEVEIDGNKVSVGAEYFETEKRLMLDGKAVETIQVGNILVLVEL
ncbi:MAG: valine--tRNA ligase [Thermoplasmata archaeon]|nr:valine--tRNA ligase [Thermoplasmata archaeon]